MTTPISGWGRYPVQPCELERPERYTDLRPFAGGVIVRGQGRSYGDASLNENGRVLLTERVNALIDADIAFHSAVYTASRNPLIQRSAHLHWSHIRRAMERPAQPRPPAVQWQSMAVRRQRCSCPSH